MNRIIRFALAALIVYILLTKTETYIPRTFLDEEWKSVRNDPGRKADPFNTCSPENYDECSKVAFPHLSRY